VLEDVSRYQRLGRGGTAFDKAHSITSPQTWATCLILMALTEVLARTAILAHRLWIADRHPPPGPAGDLSAEPRTAAGSGSTSY
jgi:hypothetical protein